MIQLTGTVTLIPFVSEVSQQLRSAMLSCMGLLGIHPLEPQYKVTVGNVAWTDFLNCHDSCDFNRLEA